MSCGKSDREEWPTRRIAAYRESNSSNKNMHGDYDRYLRSQHWTRLRKRYRQERSWRCGICDGSGSLELHHKTYKRLGNERLDDLVPLCSTCHSMLHQLHQEGQAGLDPSHIFIAALGRQRREQREQPEEFVPRHIREPRDWREERQLPRKSKAE